MRQRRDFITGVFSVAPLGASALSALCPPSRSRGIFLLIVSALTSLQNRYSAALHGGFVNSSALRPFYKAADKPPTLKKIPSTAPDDTTERRAQRTRLAMSRPPTLLSSGDRSKPENAPYGAYFRTKRGKPSKFFLPQKPRPTRLGASVMPLQGKKNLFFNKRSLFMLRLWLRIIL